jgi:hypothetical protein
MSEHGTSWPVAATCTGPITVRKDDQRLCCAINFATQNTTFCAQPITGDNLR